MMVTIVTVVRRKRILEAIRVKRPCISREAALYLLGTICGALEGKVAIPQGPVNQSSLLTPSVRVEATAQLTSTVLHGVDGGGIGMRGGMGEGAGGASGRTTDIIVTKLLWTL